MLGEQLRFTGRATINVADTTSPTLVPPDIAFAAVLTLVGTLTDNRTIVIQAPDGASWTIENETTGGFNISIAVGSGSTAMLTSGSSRTVYSRAGSAEMTSGAGSGGGGTASQVTRGDGSVGAVPAAALPAPAASTRGGVALPASASGKFLRDDGTWSTPGRPFVADEPATGDFPFTFPSDGADHLVLVPAGGPFTVNLPASPSAGWIESIVAPSDAATNVPIIGHNGHNIDGAGSDFTGCNVPGRIYSFVFFSTYGWRVTA